VTQEQIPDLTPEGVAAVETVADLARLLRQLRRREARRRGDSEWTYRELAAKTGWSLGSISGYFDGKALPPTDRFDALVGQLGATPAEQGALATARDRVEEHRRVIARASGAARSIPRQLPTAVAHFAGRAAHLAELDALRTAHGPTAVVISAISGTAGVGKTALAVYWAHRVAGEFPDGQLYVNLRGYGPTGSARGPAEVVRRLLEALGVEPQRIPVDPEAQAALYRSELAGRRVLVVLDNARDTAQVRPLLPGTPSCRVLVTSRNQLSGLVAADGAHPIALDLLTPAEARQLLARRLGTDRVTAESRAVEEIITRCAQLPLALAIAAARAATHPNLPLAVLAGELRDASQRLDALTTDDPATDVRAVFSWSYHALTPEAAQLFRLLGVHPGPDISIAAAASLAGLPVPRVRHLLAELARANLHVESAPGRHTSHDLLRAYATELAHLTDDDQQLHAATHRLLDHYLHAAHTAAHVLDPMRGQLSLTPPQQGIVFEPPADHQQALAWFTAERDVLLATIDRAAATGWDTHAWQTAWILGDFLHRRGQWHDFSTAAGVALAAAQRLADPAVQARAHRNLAFAYTRLNRFDDAHSHLRVALDLYREAGDPAGRAHTHHILAFMLGRQGHHAEAIEHDRQALDLYLARGHRAGQADALTMLGWHSAQLVDDRQALVYCEEALALHQELGDRSGQANTWDCLGFIHHRHGSKTQAISSYQRALELYRDIGDDPQEAAALNRLGEIHFATGDIDAARSSWQLALTIMDQLDHPDANAVRAKLATVDDLTGSGPG